MKIIIRQIYNKWKNILKALMDTFHEKKDFAFNIGAHTQKGIKFQKYQIFIGG